MRCPNCNRDVQELHEHPISRVMVCISCIQGWLGQRDGQSLRDRNCSRCNVSLEPNYHTTLNGRRICPRCVSIVQVQVWRTFGIRTPCRNCGYMPSRLVSGNIRCDRCNYDPSDVTTATTIILALARLSVDIPSTFEECMGICSAFEYQGAVEFRDAMLTFTRLRNEYLEPEVDRPKRRIRT